MEEIKIRKGAKVATKEEALKTFNRLINKKWTEGLYPHEEGMAEMIWEHVLLPSLQTNQHKE